MEKFSIVQDTLPCCIRFIFSRNENIGYKNLNQGLDEWSSFNKYGQLSYFNASFTDVVVPLNRSQSGYGLSSLNAFGDWLCFSSEMSADGEELNLYNQTSSQLLRYDLAEGAASSLPQSFMAGENVLYFTIDDHVHGRELWKVDFRPSRVVNDIDLRLEVFPNPSSDFVHVRGLKGDANPFWLFDHAGRMVRSGMMTHDFLAVYDLAPSVYILKVQDAKEVRQVVFLVQ